MVDPRPPAMPQPGDPRPPPAPRPDSRRGRGWRPSISVALLFGFGGLLAVAVATVLFISLRAAERNTIELSRNAAQLAIDLLVQRLDRHLAPVRNQAEFLANLLGRNDIPLDDTQRLQDLLLGSLAAAPQIGGVAFIRDDLYAVRAGRTARGPEVAAGSSLDKPEVRLALRKGASEGSVGWGEIVYLRPLDNTYITVRAPVRRNGAYRGIVSAVVSISELSGYLAPSEDSIGRSFVLYGRDHVLAHPALAGGPRGLSAERPLPLLGEVGDPVLANIWTVPIDVDGLRDLVAGTSLNARIVTAAGDRYLFLYRELTGYGPEPWLAGSYVRLSEVDAPARRLNFAVMAGGGTFIVAAILALLLGQGLSRPIRRLETVADAIRTFDFDAAPRLPGNLFRELDAAAKAFNAMLAGLRWFETYVPKPLVLRLMRQSAQAGLASEERTITVLFTDIVDFTVIGRQKSAPELAAFLNRHFALLGTCIESEGGTIDKYIGDSVMAFWGAPADDPNHADRACRAALAIAEAIRADNDRRAAAGLARLRLRIGIHTGTAIVGNVGAPGRINYTPIGDTVNIAQRLEQLGKELDDGKSEVIALISAATAAILSPGIAATSAGRLQLRGHGEAIELFRLI